MDGMEWLGQKAFPLWVRQGVDRQHGGFHESLDFSGQPLELPKRAMVQARQFFCLRVGSETGCIASAIARPLIESGLDFLLSHYSLPNGAFAHSVTPEGKLHDANPDLYGQAFSLFGLAQAQRVHANAQTSARALKLLDYLQDERRLPEGGFSELKDGQLLREANPHMHLFEAAIAWMQTDPHPRWRALAEEILALCRQRFIDETTGLLAEHFGPGWEPLRDSGHFIFEPGHHYEWAWLLLKFDAIAGTDHRAIAQKLFTLAETRGVCPRRRAAYDEVRSDGRPQRTSARFWPQCERIKAAQNLEDTPARDEALRALFRYFQTPTPGLWYDTWNDSDEFTGSTVKASSFYHIVGALTEARHSPKIH